MLRVHKTAHSSLGMTLLELIVAIGILLILATAALPLTVTGPKPIGSMFGSSFDNWAQPITKTQVPNFSMFPGGSSSGPVTMPTLRPLAPPTPTQPPPLAPTVPSTSGHP